MTGDGRDDLPPQTPQAREESPHQPVTRGRTPIPFAGVARRIEAEKNTEKERELRWLRLCAAHEEGQKNAEEAHATLHEWLIANDADYRSSAEISLCCEDLRRRAGPVIDLTVGLLAAYAATRNEVTLACNTHFNKIPGVAFAAIRRLSLAHAPVTEALQAFSGRVETLNRMVAGTVYRDLRLHIPGRIVAPDCAEGMPYFTLKNNFEASADQTRESVRVMEEILEVMESVPATMEHILFDYRETLRRHHLAGVCQSPPGMLAG